MKKMKTGILLLLLLFAVALFPVVNSSGSYPGLEISTAHADEKVAMDQVQLIMKKLRASMASMKDFDELEQAGMDKKDVERMRRAMHQKIEKLTDEAVELIRAL